MKLVITKHIFKSITVRAVEKGQRTSRVSISTSAKSPDDETGRVIGRNRAADKKNL